MGQTSLSDGDAVAKANADSLRTVKALLLAKLQEEDSPDNAVQWAQCYKLLAEAAATDRHP